MQVKHFCVARPLYVPFTEWRLRTAEVLGSILVKDFSVVVGERLC